MSFRGRGRGRGGFGGFRPAKQVPWELFPEIEDLGTAKFPVSTDTEIETKTRQLIKWSLSLEKFFVSSPFFIDDKENISTKRKLDNIERYSDRKLKATKSKRQELSDFIKKDPNHMPAELCEGGQNEKQRFKRVRWNPQSDSHKLDLFETLEKKHQGDEKKENKEEEEDEESENEMDDGEFSDEGDYEQPLHDFEDDEDDYNMAEENNDEDYY